MKNSNNIVSNKRKWAGRGLMAASAAIPLAFGIRGMKLARKFGRIVEPVKDVERLGNEVGAWVAETGAKLPEFKFVTKPFGRVGKSALDAGIPVYYGGGNAFTDVLAENIANFSGKKPNKLMKFFLRRLSPFSGPAYTPGGPGFGEAITLGPRSLKDPRILLHELGHAQDVRNGKFVEDVAALNPSKKNWMKDIYYGLVNPEKTRTLKLENRAWDNAKIAPDDELRQAALDTYRNIVRMKSVNTVAGIPMFYAGYGINKSAAMKKKAFNVKPLATGMKDTEKFVNLLMKKLSMKQLERMAYAPQRTYGDLKLSALAAARRAHDLGLPDTHSSWAGIRRSLAQLAEEDSPVVDTIRSNDSSRKLMAAIAKALKGAGATSFN